MSLTARENPLKNIGAQTLVKVAPKCLYEKLRQRDKPKLRALLRLKWPHKFVVLAECCLYIYGDEASSKYEAAFSMAEFKCVDVHIDREQCFFLIFGDPEKEHIVFCCDTNRSLKKWIKKLKEAIYAFDSGIGHEEEAEESDDEDNDDEKEGPYRYMQIKDNIIPPTADDRTTSNDNHGEEPQYENFGHFAGKPNKTHSFGTNVRMRTRADKDTHSKAEINANRRSLSSLSSTDSESAFALVTDRKGPPVAIDQADVQTSTLKKKQANEVVDDKPGDTHDDFYENVLHGGAHNMSMRHPKMDNQLTHGQSKIKGVSNIGRPKTDVNMTRPNKTRPQTNTNSSSASKTNSENPMVRVPGRDHSSTSSKNQGESQSIKMRAIAIEQSLKLGYSMGKGTPRSHSCAHLHGAHKVSCEYPENDDQETHVQRRIKGGRKIGPSKTDAKMDVNTRYPIKTNSCSALETNSENATIDGSGREKKYSTVLKKGESQSMRLRINEFEQSSKSANSFGKGLSKNITSSKLKGSAQTTIPVVQGTTTPLEEDPIYENSQDLYENVDYPAVKNDKRAGATTK
ncbi:uncharacterized protein LOC128246496 isoform X2 [Mya arenaria]|uniref:uncharacterized protein LOC128246496 isoform X2 n=1 Tax=Mya arenaria TaxID=6604 RepID=UPI0022E2D1EA|nr:uncharacterized protein LOC128246496 isoform X2 [Mya arenaria]